MAPSRGGRSRKSNSSVRSILFFAVCLGILYGFYLESREFHPEAKGIQQQHRKELREVEIGTKQPPPNDTQSEDATDSLQAAGPTVVMQLSYNKNGLVKRPPPPPPPPDDEDAIITDNLADGIFETGQQMADEMGKAAETVSKGVLDLSDTAHDTLVAADVVQPKDNADKKYAQSISSIANEQEIAQDGKDGFQALPSLKNLTEQRATDVTKFMTRWRNHSAAIDSGTSEAEWAKRAEVVKTATKETWAVYEKHAMGRDELMPLTLEGKSVFGDLGAMLIDSLDTLWMMGLQPEFDRARQWVADNLNFDKKAKLSLFETTIRIVGGLLSTFDLSEDTLFLNKAQQLVDLLMPVFNATVIPTNVVYINQGSEKGKAFGSQVGRAAIAEFGSLQVEFLALSQRTANTTYGETAEALLQYLFQKYPDKGMLPVWYSRRQGKASGSNLFTVGAMGDSFFEYLLKLWLLHQKQDEMYRQMWEKSTDEILDELVAISPGGLTFVGQKKSRSKFVGKMEHLACYFPGNIALGVAEGAVAGAKAHHYLEVAANLTYTCWQMYERTSTGLGIDLAMFDSKGDLQPKDPRNNLRPETVESLFYMWRVTGEPKYREWGWQIFQAFQRHSRTPEGAYAVIEDVNAVPVKQANGMETFWVAETLKYLWLLFSPDEALSLDEWVLNTEAHPLRISLAKT